MDNNYVFVAISFLILGVSCWGLYKYFRKDPNTIVVGISTDYAPFSYKDKGQLTGFDIELAKELGNKLGKKVVFKEMSFPSLISSLKKGSIDIIASGISPTEIRLQTVDFTEPYHNDSYCMVTREKKIKSLADLKGLQVGVQTGSVIEAIVRKWGLENNFKVVSYDLNSQILESLKAGHLQGLFIASTEGNAIAKENNELVCKILDGMDNKTESTAMALQKLSPMTEQVNNILQELRLAGTIEILKKKYGLTVVNLGDNTIVAIDDFDNDDDESSEGSNYNSIIEEIFIAQEPNNTLESNKSLYDEEDEEEDKENDEAEDETKSEDSHDEVAAEAAENDEAEDDDE